MIENITKALCFPFILKKISTLFFLPSFSKIPNPLPNPKSTAIKDHKGDQVQPAHFHNSCSHSHPPLNLTIFSPSISITSLYGTLCSPPPLASLPAAQMKFFQNPPRVLHWSQTHSAQEEHFQTKKSPTFLQTSQRMPPPWALVKVRCAQPDMA